MVIDECREREGREAVRKMPGFGPRVVLIGPRKAADGAAPACLPTVGLKVPVIPPQFPEVVPLNIGGAHFTTRLSTLRRYEDTMLAAMFSGRHYIPTDAEGRYFIDRDGVHFGYVPPSAINCRVLASEQPGLGHGTLMSSITPRRGGNLLVEFNKCAYCFGSEFLVSFPEEARTAGEIPGDTHWLDVMKPILLCKLRLGSCHPCGIGVTAPRGRGVPTQLLGEDHQIQILGLGIAVREKHGVWQWFPKFFQ